MNKASSVDEYITSCPQEMQGKLNELRAVIKELAPRAEEKISYGMPYYGYQGRLAYFALAKHHIGLYIPPPIIEEHAQDLKNYTTSKSAVQLPLNQNLPIELIKKLIKARMKHNEGQGKKK